MFENDPKMSLFSNIISWSISILSYFGAKIVIVLISELENVTFLIRFSN